MRVLLVVNPHASRVTDRSQVAVAKRLRRQHEVVVRRTEHRDHATAIARDALHAGTEVIAVLGGDGTLNEVANAIAGTGCILAALPGGSTNVFCRTLGLPNDPVAAAALLSDSLDRAAVRSIGLGSVDGRFFAFHTGVGWDAELVRIVESHARLKRRLGHAVFVAAGLRAFFSTYDRSHPHFHVRTDDGTTIDDAIFAVVMNSDPYTFVGSRPFTIAPTTTTDESLTVVVARSMTVRAFGPLALDALRDRRGVSSGEDVVVVSGVQSATIERITDPPRAMPHQVDGDHLGQADRLEFRYHRDALRIADVSA